MEMKHTGKPWCSRALRSGVISAVRCSGVSSISSCLLPKGQDLVNGTLQFVAPILRIACGCLREAKAVILRIKSCCSSVENFSTL